MKKNQNGLTLLELLIAMSLMAVLSITTTQMLRKSTSQTKKITSGLDQLNYMRAALNVIKNDVSKAVNFRDLNLFLYNEAQKERIKRYDSRVKKWVDDLNKNEKPSPQATVQNLTEAQKQQMIEDGIVKPELGEEKKEVIYTHFVGDKEKFYFTTKSGVRFREKDKISDLSEVGYFLRTCRSRRDLKNDSQCLWRSVSYNVDEDVTKGGKESVLIENVEEIKFKYLGFGSEDIRNQKADWVNSWDSRSIGDQRTGNSFPAAVKIDLTVRIPDKRIKDKSKLKIERITGVFSVDFANNNPFEQIKKSSTTTSSSENSTPSAPTNNPQTGSVGDF